MKLTIEISEETANKLRDLASDWAKSDHSEQIVLVMEAETSLWRGVDIRWRERESRKAQAQ